MRFSIKTIVLMITVLTVSCSNEDDNLTQQIEVPETYSFFRNGSSTVSYEGQTVRIRMGNELGSALKNPEKNANELLNMYAHEQGELNFSDAQLNGSDKSLKSKTAASRDYYSGNTTLANEIKSNFEGWINAQVNEVYPSWNLMASPGMAGQLQEGGGGSVRYISGKGLEYDQAFVKGLIGALMTDQMLNNYLSTAVLDEGENVINNDNKVLVEGKNYTQMEHKWDEAFGYMYGNEADAANPQLNVDSFLNKYLSRVENDPDFAGIAADIYNAFKTGRAAIVSGDYELRDEQAELIKEAVSEIIGIRAVYYLQQAKLTLGTDNAAAFHDLSEGYGFIYSLQFTRKPGTNEPYFSNIEVNGFLNTLLEGNGFWDLSLQQLDQMSQAISERFNFKLAEAAN